MTMRVEKPTLKLLPKKNNVREFTNSCTIALIPHASKILLRIVLKWLEPYMEREMTMKQAGFDSVKKRSIQRARGQNAGWRRHNRRLHNPNRWKAGCNLPPGLSNLYSTCTIRTAVLEDMETGVRIMHHWISWHWTNLYQWSIKDLFPFSKKHHTI